MVEVDTEFWERHLLFRDYLRSHPAAVAQYALLKHQLAAKHQTNLDGYTEDKTTYIRAIEQEARAALGGQDLEDRMAVAAAVDAP